MTAASTTVTRPKIRPSAFVKTMREAVKPAERPDTLAEAMASLSLVLSGPARGSLSLRQTVTLTRLYGQASAKRAAVDPTYRLIPAVKGLWDGPRKTQEKWAGPEAAEGSPGDERREEGPAGR